MKLKENKNKQKRDIMASKNLILSLNQQIKI